jgi:hypothetical protein
LLVLLLVPGGLGGALFRARDIGLRWVARRRGIVVPSLLADVRVLEAEAEQAFELRAAGPVDAGGTPTLPPDPAVADAEAEPVPVAVEAASAADVDRPERTDPPARTEPAAAPAPGGPE